MYVDRTSEISVGLADRPFALPREPQPPRAPHAGGPRAIHADLVAMLAPTDDADLAFDGHVLACLFSVALDEVGRGEASLCDALGLDAGTLGDIGRRWFRRLDVVRTVGPAPEVEMEEELLRDLLAGHLVEGDEIGLLLVPMIARRAMRPDHLWQDLGLFDRGELNRLLARHFPTLHAGNTANMRWKKYFYRKLCEAEGFALCTAPSCSVCADFASCFGSEDGESRMASVRRTADLALHAAE